MELKKTFKKEFKLALKKIKEYETIVVFRHQRPDYDAFGTQLGLANWIRDSFPTKKVYYVGANHSTFTGDLYPEMQIVDDEVFEGKFLAIVVDTGNSPRIDDERCGRECSDDCSASFVKEYDCKGSLCDYGYVFLHPRTSRLHPKWIG